MNNNKVNTLDSVLLIPTQRIARHPFHLWRDSLRKRALDLLNCLNDDPIYFRKLAVCLNNAALNESVNGQVETARKLCFANIEIQARGPDDFMAVPIADSLINLARLDARQSSKDVFWLKIAWLETHVGGSLTSNDKFDWLLLSDYAFSRLKNCVWLGEQRKSAIRALEVEKVRMLVQQENYDCILSSYDKLINVIETRHALYHEALYIALSAKSNNDAQCLANRWKEKKVGLISAVFSLRLSSGKQDTLSIDNIDSRRFIEDIYSIIDYLNDSDVGTVLSTLFIVENVFKIFANKLPESVKSIIQSRAYICADRMDDEVFRKSFNFHPNTPPERIDPTFWDELISSTIVFNGGFRL